MLLCCELILYDSLTFERRPCTEDSKLVDKINKTSYKSNPIRCRKFPIVSLLSIHYIAFHHRNSERVLDESHKSECGLTA